VPLTKIYRSTNWPPAAGEKGNQMSDIQFEQLTAAEASSRRKDSDPLASPIGSTRLAMMSVCARSTAAMAP
jgi:hypothetical protein